MAVILTISTPDSVVATSTRPGRQVGRGGGGGEGGGARVSWKTLSAIVSVFAINDSHMNNIAIFFVAAIGWPIISAVPVIVSGTL